MSLQNKELISFINTHDLQRKLSFLSVHSFMKTLVQNLKTALNLLCVRGRKVVFSFSYVCVSLHLGLHPHHPRRSELSVFIKPPHITSEGQYKCVQQLIEALSPPQKQSLAADFDQVSSFGRRAKFPDNIACCGNRNLEVSGDTRVALSVHTWLHFYV